MARVLAVDDSKTMRQLVVFTLTGAGHAVHEAESFDSALVLAKANLYDLVISDVNMPGKDGIALVRALRDLPNTRLTPILMLTTESATTSRQAGKLAGATGWIVKPFQPNQLLETVDKVLKR